MDAWDRPLPRWAQEDDRSPDDLRDELMDGADSMFASIDPPKPAPVSQFFCRYFGEIAA